MAQGNGCYIPDCKYYGWLFDKAGKGCVCHHPDTESETCPLKKEAATSPQTYPAPVTYPEPEEDAEEAMKDWYAVNVRQ